MLLFWDEQARRDSCPQNSIRSSEQRHVKAARQHEEFDEPQSNPLCSAHTPRLQAHVPGGETRGGPEGAWDRKRPSHRWALWSSCCHVSSSTHPEHLSCSFFTFSHIQATGQLLLALLHASLGRHRLRGGLLQAWNDTRAVSRAHLSPDPEGPGPQGHLLCSQPRP